MKALPAVTAASMLVLANTAAADCIVGAKLSLQFIVVDAHTIILKNAGGHDILIKSFAFFYPTSQVTILKDSFCDYASAVLYVDGQVIDAQEVKNL
jgi:hypothetical protein